MISDRQVRRVLELSQTEKTKVQAADKAGMDVKTAQKYVRVGKMPSEMQTAHTWRTRRDPFGEVWEAVREKLAASGGMLEAKTLFEHLQGERPGAFRDGQIRTLQLFSVRVSLTSLSLIRENPRRGMGFPFNKRNVP
jgi:hypothetical protein